MFFFDMTYIWLVLIPSLVLSFGAQMWVRRAYEKWGNTRNSASITGAQIGPELVRSAGLGGVRFEGTPGELSDHYDPSGHIVRMSEGIATKPSVASMAIVAHELGHAQQYEENSVFISMRSFLLPAMRFSPMASYGLIFMGLIFGLTGLAWLGVGFFAITVLFMLLTLPVEFDASRRGMAILQSSGLMNAQDASGARQMLTAAALTYVAAFVTSLLTLIYYISLLNSNR